MQDIGKVAVADSILLKQGKLTDEEFEIMKMHAVAHHERWDGTGYPRGLKGSAIPLSGRLCSAVDVFDALTSIRPYKASWPVESAVRYLDEAAGTHFDPDVIALFHESMPEILDIRRRFEDRRANAQTLESREMA